MVLLEPIQEEPVVMAEIMPIMPMVAVVEVVLVHLLPELPGEHLPEQ